MSYPALTVEVAFVADPYGTLTWTDVTAYWLGCDFQRGRNYELGKTEAGTLNVSLENLDGQFDPTNASSPYFPYVLPYRPIRVRATWLTVTYDLWRGYVERWPQKWSTGGNYGTVDITAVDGFKTVLGKKYGTRLYDQVQSLSPLGYSRFDGLAVGASIAAGTGGTGGATDAGQGTQVGTNTVFFTSVSQTVDFDRNGRASLVAGSPDTALEYSCPAATSTTLFVHGPILRGTSEMWIKPNFTGATSTYPMTTGYGPPAILSGSGTNNTVGGSVGLGYTSGTNNYILSTLDLNAGLPAWVDTGVRIARNVTSHVVIVSSNLSTERATLIYINGALVYTTTIAGNITCTNPSGINGYIKLGINAVGSTTGFAVGDTFTVDELSVYSGNQLNATEIALHYQLGRGNTYAEFPAETTSQRVSDVLDTALWPTSARVSTGGGSGLLATGSAKGRTALDLIQEATDAELGNVFINGAGSFVFQNRATRNSPSSAATFGDGAGEIPYQGDIRIDFDDTYIYNALSVTQSGSSPAVTSVAGDSASENSYGPRDLPLTVPLSASADLTGQANTLLARYKDPHARVPQVTLEGRGNTDNFAQMLSREIGDLVTINRRPLGATAISIGCFIDGIKHHITPTEWTTTFMLTPQYPNATY